MTQDVFTPSTFSLVVHGGAGTILRNTMTPAREAAYHAGLRRALEAGRLVLAAGSQQPEAGHDAVRFDADRLQGLAGRLLFQ